MAVLGSERAPHQIDFPCLGMAGSGRRCEYKLPGVNGKSCGILTVRDSPGKVFSWPVFTVAGPATIPVDDHIERQVTGQTRSYRLCLYSIWLKDNTRPIPVL
jgi:hypothetical protein